MPTILRNGLLAASALFFVICAAAQTEFPKEFIAHVRLTSGAITRFNSSPDFFTGSLQIVPQYTIRPHWLRGGAIAALTYGQKKVSGLFGPTISLKLKEFKAGYFGTLGNIHLNVDQLWGTNKQRLFGGGINLDLLNKLIISFTTHRDYKQSGWWLQTGIAFRISKIKTPVETFPH